MMTATTASRFLKYTACCTTAYLANLKRVFRM